MTVTASELVTIRLISGAKVLRSGPLQLSSDEKKVETSAAFDARLAAIAKTPCGMGQKACTTSNLPSLAIRAAAADPAATYEGRSVPNSGFFLIRSTAGASCVSVSSDA